MNVSAPAAPRRPLLHAVGHQWIRLPLVFAIALSFALFVRVTLWGSPSQMDPGPKGLLLPGALVAALVGWYLVATWLVGRCPGGSSGLAGSLMAASFLPMLATLPISLGVLVSESYAQEYWIDRSVKVELLLGLPLLVLMLQAGVWCWFHFRLTWRRAGPMLAVLGGGLALRYAGMGWGLPFALQPEETSIYARWANEAALHGQWNPHYFQNPSLLIHLLSMEFLGLYAVCRALLFGQDPGELYMVFRAEQDLFYAVARLNSVVLGTATLFIIYLIGRRLWGERVGLLAAALLAVNFLHVRNSQHAVNDVPATFFMVASFYFALRLAERGRWRDYLLAGLLAGVATSTKYNGGMIVIAIAAAHWVHHIKLSRSLQPRPLSRLSASAAAALGGFVLGTPYSVLDFPGFSAGFLEQLAMGAAPWSGQTLEPSAWQFLTTAAHGAGLTTVLLALLGGVLMLAGDRRQALLLLSFPVCYFVFMSTMSLFFIRWVVPVMPFVALLGAYGLSRGVRWLPSAGRYPVAVGLILLALLQPAVYSARLAWLAHQTDTRHEANAWAARNLPAGSKVAVEAFSLLDLESLAFRSTLHHLEIDLVWRATMRDLDSYRRDGFHYLAVSSFMYDRAFSQPERYADRVEFYRQLDREYPLAAAFAPRADGKAPPFALDDLDTPFWHIFSYERPGPVVKVYRLAP